MTRPDPAPATLSAAEENPGDVATRFQPWEGAARIRPFGSGNINRTWLVEPDGGDGEAFLLQRLNTEVFSEPDLVTANIRAVLGHLERRLEVARPASAPDWKLPRVVPTNEGADRWLGQDGSYWRAQSFIARSRTVDAVRDPDVAREAGRGLGTFHALLADLPAAGLADTLPGFHVTPAYLAAYDRIGEALAATSGGGDNPRETWARQFVDRHRHWAMLLEEAREDGRIRERPVHGDPKINNILLDESSGRAVAMIDLDTVKPGLLHWDIGDCLRSSCNPSGEEAVDWQGVRLDLGLAEALLEGYLDAVGDGLDEGDLDLIPESARLLAFELGLRFLADHLAGDRYFRVTRRGQNLDRALVQLRLAEDSDSCLEDLRRLVRRVR